MTDLYIYQFPAKTAPVGADIVYLGDSASSFSEVKSTITEIIVNNNIVAVSGSYTSSNFPVWTASNEIADSGVTVDHSQNITNVNTLTLAGDPTLSSQAATKHYADLKFAIANNLSEGTPATMRANLGLGTSALKTASDNTQTGVASVKGATVAGHVPIFADALGTLQDGGSTGIFLEKANNLNDVASKPISFNTISPTSTQGDLIVYSGGTNNRLGIGATGQVLGVSAGLPVWQDLGPDTGFLDNAIFASTSGLASITNSSTAIPLDTVISSTTGNLWIPNGDGVGMRCGTTGTYLFIGLVPVMHVGASGGYVIFTFYKNGSQINPNVPYFITGVAAIMQMSNQAMINCTAGDVINLQAVAPASAPGYSIASTATTGASYATSVSIIRIK